MKPSLRRLLLGVPRDPFDPGTRRRLALVALLAWIGLGADGLSSANYGPAEAYIALGRHGALGIFVALAMAVTVFLIAVGYNQVIELFPSGGGGYKVATKLLGGYAGLAAGCALVVDYVLTVTISIAAAADALFSLLPSDWLHGRIAVAAAAILILTWLNLRGIKESVIVLAPIFLGFLATHGVLVVWGLIARGERLSELAGEAIGDAAAMADDVGWLLVIAIVLRAYSLGAGTYTGIEAVSNNVHVLAEPRVRTGKLTMLYMATALAFMATGLMLLYLAWQVAPEHGRTLNAVVFREVLGSAPMLDQGLRQAILTVTLAFAAGLLIVAGNTGFLGGPAVLANMSLDQWVPHQFSHLSSRLVTHAGVILMGASAMLLLFVTSGRVDILVVLYSINVFITFTLCLAGLCVFWWRHRDTRRDWRRGLAVAAAALTAAAAILTAILLEKFLDGGWISILVTSLLAAFCLAVRRHYRLIARRLRVIDEELRDRQLAGPAPAPVAPDPSKPTAALLIGGSYGAGLHTLLAVQRLFPRHFSNFVLVSVGEVDASSYGGEAALRALKRAVRVRLARFARTCHARGFGTASYQAFGTDVVAEVTAMLPAILRDFPNVVFFAPKVTFERDNWFTRLLHNQTPLLIQRRLARLGVDMMVVPLRLEVHGR